ncbi:MAG: ferritin-like domain-containing protein [Armatimonadota bacterium]|nr:MAG: ferritin-like domain-containing protein [Armatimonadota bacterium]
MRKDDRELIQLLNQAIELEYGALFLMPQHMARLNDDELVMTLREACQDELEHAETTARLILSLGGLPTGDFKMLRPMSSAADMLRHHIDGEKRVIDLYRRAVAKAQKPEHQTILRKLIADEEAHQKVFARLLAQVEAASKAPA